MTLVCAFVRHANNNLLHSSYISVANSPDHKLDTLKHFIYEPGSTYAIF